MENDSGQRASGTPEPTAASPQTHRVLRPGETFGNYRVVRCICAGLLLNYYHMQHLRDLHDVTVGIFHPRTMADAKCLRRLQNLQKIINESKHEGIPKIRECAILQGQHCIFIDPIGGENLSKFLSDHGKPGVSGLEKEVVAHNLALLLGVLGYAHSQGIDHRDLDSDLIFLQPDGTIRVLGLGIKAALGVDLFESVVSASVSPLDASQNAARLNSFDVMSPEYRAGVEEDQRVDVYAVGVIGYWLLTGIKPARPEHQPPSELIEKLPPVWDRFFAKALLRNNELRYQSCRVALLGLKETEAQPDSEEAGFIQRQIDRIPVPKGIRERGELVTRVYRLSLIGLVGVILTAIAAYFMQLAFTEEPVEHTQNVAIRAPKGTPPNLSMQVTPATVKVEFLSYQDRFLSNRGTLNLLVQRGRYSVRVSAPHYLDQTFDVTIERGQPVERTVHLKQAWTGLKIHTVAGASIAAIDENGVEVELGKANEQGVLHLKQGILAGTYQLAVRKEGYVPLLLNDQKLTYGEMAELQAPLEALPAGLMVETQPAGAKIFLDEVYVGTSPVSLGQIDAVGEMFIVAKLDGYRPVRKRVAVEPGTIQKIDLGELQALSGELNVEVDFERDGAEDEASLSQQLMVDLDGRLLPLGASDLWNVSVGQHVVSLVHPVYETEPQRIEVSDQSVEALHFVMRPKPGQLHVRIPVGLVPEIRLNGQLAQLVDGDLRIPSKQDVELELRIRNYLTMVRRLNMQPGEEDVWDVHPVPIPGPEAGQAWTMPYLGLEFAWVAPGEFTLGSPLQEHARLPNEGPQVEVRFTRGFWAGCYEVTQAQYRVVAGKNPSKFQGARKPVERVSWEDAKQYCARLTEIERAAKRLPEGYVYRLPTEAEWEYFARAGTDTPYSFAGRADPTMGNFQGYYPLGSAASDTVESLYGTCAVGSYAPNAYGIYDVHGNVCEWTLDAYRSRYDGGSLTDPAPVREQGRIAVRGGSWKSYARHTRSAWREELRAETATDELGFRVVLAPEY